VYRPAGAHSSAEWRPWRGDRSTESSAARNPRRGRSSNRACCRLRVPAEWVPERTAEPSSRYDRSSKTTRDMTCTCSNENVPQHQSRRGATSMRRIPRHPEPKRRGAPPRARAPVDIQNSSFSGSPVSRREAFVAGGRMYLDVIFDHYTASVKRVRFGRGSAELLQRRSSQARKDRHNGMVEKTGHSALSGESGRSAKSAHDQNARPKLRSS
jgi:hypothetical protein